MTPAEASAAAPPFRREAEVQCEHALAWREPAKVERKAQRKAQAQREGKREAKRQAKLEALMLKAVDAERLARDASAKAQGIEDAMYDLKAVNPAVRDTGDRRTSAQLLDATQIKGREVDEASSRLCSLLPS